MAKGTKNKSAEQPKNVESKNRKSDQNELKLIDKRESGYLASMGYAPKIAEEYHWFQSVPIVAFSTVFLVFWSGRFNRLLQLLQNDWNFSVCRLSVINSSVSCFHPVFCHKENLVLYPYPSILPVSSAFLRFF
jgi:hypothetical protein